MDRGSVVSEALWGHRELIDAYVRKNPLGVTPDQLDVIRPWAYAVRDPFTCVSASHEGTSYGRKHREEDQISPQMQRWIDGQLFAPAPDARSV
jgi:hypothetical protein